MRDKCGGIDRQRAGCLNRVRQLQPQRGSQSRSALRNVDIELDRVPAFERCTIASGKHLIACLQRASQHLGNRDGRYRKPQPAKLMSFKQRVESRCEPRMTFK